MKHPVALALLLAACAPGGSFEGTVTNGITGEPVKGLRLMLKAQKTSDMSCAAAEATTGDDGSFAMGSTCAATTYDLSVNDDSLLLEGSITVEGGVPLTGQALKVFRGPKGSGLYTLHGDLLEPVRKSTDMESDTFFKSEVKFSYPAKSYKTLPTLYKDGYLVMGGKGMADKVGFHTLNAVEGSMKVIDGTLTPNNIIDYKMLDEAAFEEDRVTIDTSGFIALESGENAVTYVPASALPPRNYALFGEGDSRLTFLTVSADAAPAAPAAEAPAE